MPHLNGLQLYNRMGDNKPVRILFVSALDAVEVVSILPDIRRNSNQKPVEKDHFVRSVQLAISQ